MSEPTESADSPDATHEGQPSEPGIDSANEADGVDDVEQTRDALAVDLTPATYDPSEKGSAFKDGAPWKLALGLITLGALFIAAQFWVRHNERERVRTGLLERYDNEVLPAAADTNALVERITGWVVDAAASEPEAYVDPELRFSDLHDRRGLYLRIDVSQASTPAEVAEAMRQMNRDAITRCMGLNPTNARTLYEIAPLFQASWRQTIVDEEDEMQLKVLETRLDRRVRRELPVAESLQRSEYLLMVISHGHRGRDPVDAYVRELPSGRIRFAGRVQANGRLLTVRFGRGGPEVPEEALTRSGATDCSIAGLLKGLAGEPVGTSDG